MAKPFLYIYNYFAVNRKIFFTVFIALFLITGFFSLKIKPEEDISKILPKDRQTGKLNEILQNARFADKLVLMVSMKDSNKISPETLAAFSDSFADIIRKKYPDLIRSVEEQVNDSLVPQLMELVMRHLPVFLEPDDYTYLDSLQEPGKIKEILSQDVQTFSSPAGFLMKPYISKDPLGIITPAVKKIRQIQYDENFDLYDGHIVSKDGRYMLLFVSPAFPADNTGKNRQLLKEWTGSLKNFSQLDSIRLRQIILGSAAVAAGNAAQLRKDSFLTLRITTLFLILFISWYFKKKRAPFLILLPVILGALFSLSIIYWIKGTISVIALAAGSIVLGIAINYSLHVYNHFRHRRDMRLVLRTWHFR